MNEIQIYRNVPAKFYELKPHELIHHYEDSFLFHLEGEVKEPIFISCLLHGNETTGFYAIQKFLKDNIKLKRSLIIFVGNIKAAALSVRKLDNQQDYNRIWAGGTAPENQMATQIIKYLREHKVVTCLDIHNNTGKNPYYGCINRLESDYLNLGSLFSNKIIFFTEPHEVLSNAMAAYCPSITIECGLPEQDEGVEYVATYIDRLITESNSEDFLKAPYQDFDVYHSIGRIKIPEVVEHDFELDPNSKNNISLQVDFDELNFMDVAPSTLIGYYRDEESRLVVLDNNDKIVTSKFFKFSDGKILTKSSMIPSMFTKNIKISKEDCLGYLMEKIKVA
jgi:succinylglutamate desuccinylase